MDPDLTALTSTATMVVQLLVSAATTFGNSWMDQVGRDLHVSAGV